jgi:hypothetical protein
MGDGPVSGGVVNEKDISFPLLSLHSLSDNANISLLLVDSLADSEPSLLPGSWVVAMVDWKIQIFM